MRLTLLSAVCLLFLHTAFAAVPSFQQAVQPADPASVAKPPAHVKKGTLGFVSGLVLGPVGLGGVYLFSHNHAQRKAAKKGCAIFATVVVIAALCWLIVLAGKSGSGVGSSSHSGSSSGNGSGSSGGSGRPGGSGGAGRSGGASHGSGHSSNSNWANNINWPSGGSGPKQKKPSPGQLPADLQSTMGVIY